MMGNVAFLLLEKLLHLVGYGSGSDDCYNDGYSLACCGNSSCGVICDCGSYSDAG